MARRPDLRTIEAKRLTTLGSWALRGGAFGRWFLPRLAQPHQMLNGGLFALRLILKDGSIASCVYQGIPAR